jgi:hypothetical protein
MIGRAQRLGCWQGFLNLFKLCVAKARKVTYKLNEPVFQHFLTSMVQVGYYLASH